VKRPIAVINGNSVQETIEPLAGTRAGRSDFESESGTSTYVMQERSARMLRQLGLWDVDVAAAERLHSPAPPHSCKEGRGSHAAKRLQDLHMPCLTD
jgi:hypothetical protein